MARGRSFVLPAFLAASALLPLSLAVRRDSVTDLNGLSAAEEEGAGSGLREEGEDEFPTADINAAAMQSRTKVCVRARAEEFADEYTWLNLTAPTPEAKEQVEPLLLKLLGVEDKINRHQKHLSNYFKPIGWVKRFRSSTRKELEKKKKALKEQLRLQGFSYDVAAKRCDASAKLFGGGADGLTDDVYQCMQAQLQDQSSAKPKAVQEELQALLLRRITAEELLAHEQRKDVKKSLKGLREAASEALKAADFSYTTAMKACKDEVGRRPTDVKLRARAMEELDVGDTVDGVCQEEGQMCPEGTAPDTQRRILLQRGAKAATMTFVVLKGAFAVGFGVAGLLAGGPAGLAAGLATGFFAAPATPFSAAAGFLFSIGPKTCACFLRDCEFDAAAGVCALAEGTSAASSNPFGRALPYAGTKCGLKWKSTDECEVLQCTTEDFGLAHTTAVSGKQYFGKFGTYEGDATLYNCLSENGKSDASLGLLTALPGAANNTPQDRNVIFRALGLAEKKDTQKAPKDLPGGEGEDEDDEEEDLSE